MATVGRSVTSFSPLKKHTDPERWICIYPAYLDRTKTRAEGRRIPKDKAVDTPRYEEIRDVLIAAKLRIGIERKQYPRETSREIEHLGRIRVWLKNDDGKPANPQFPTRESVFLYLGDMIPQLKSRQGRTVTGDASSSVADSEAGKKKKKGGR